MPPLDGGPRQRTRWPPIVYVYRCRHLRTVPDPDLGSDREGLFEAFLLLGGVPVVGSPPSDEEILLYIYDDDGNPRYGYPNSDGSVLNADEIADRLTHPRLYSLGDTDEEVEYNILRELYYLCGGRTPLDRPLRVNEMYRWLFDPFGKLRYGYPPSDGRPLTPEERSE